MRTFDLFLCLFFVCLAAHALPFTLVKEGRPVSTLVVSRWTDREEVLAANQLRNYVLRVTGAELPVLTAAYDNGFLAKWSPGDRLPAVAPYGELRPIFVSLDASLDTEEYRLEVLDTHIRIIGGSSYGLLYGADDLLERLGLCLAAPQRLWWNLPKCQTLAVEECVATSKPFFRIRAVHCHSSDQALFDWMGVNRLNYRLQNPPGWYDGGALASHGIKPFFISHSWAFWIPRNVLHEHQDWNPEINGERKAIEADGPEALVHYQLCISNPEVRDYITARVLQYLRDNPQATIIPLEANDGGGYCECEACTAYGATVSERFFRFVAEVAGAVGHEFPNVTVLCLSYNAHDDLPEVRLPENVGIGVVYNDRNYARPLTDPSNSKDYSRLVQWAAAYPGRVYIYELWEKTRFRDYPHPYAVAFTEDIRLYRDLKLAGLCPEGLHPSPFQEYLRGKLSWNPDLEWQDLLKEFCTKMFDKAAAPMEHFYTLLEERMAEYGRNLDDLTAISEYVAPIDQTARALLDEAAALANSPLTLARVEAKRTAYDKLHDTLEQWMPCTKDIVTDEMRAANLLPNGDFEDGWANIDTDTRWGKYHFDVVDGLAYHGDNCGEVTVETQGWARFVLRANGLDTGRKYALYCAVRGVDGAEAGNFWFIPGGMPAQLYTLGNTHGEWYRVVFHNVEIREDTITILPTVHDVPTKGRILYDDILLLPEE